MLGKSYTSWTVPEPRHFPLTMTPGHNFTWKHRNHMGPLWTADSPWQRSQGLHKTPSWIWGFQKLQVCPVCRTPSCFSSWSPELSLEETTTPYMDSGWLEPCLAWITFFITFFSSSLFSSSIIPFVKTQSSSSFSLLNRVCLFLYWFLSLIMSYRKFLNFCLTQKLHFLKRKLNTMASKNLNYISCF